MIFDAPKERISVYVSERTGCKFHGGFTALAYARDDKILCGAVFDIWRGTDIEISAAGEAFPRSFLRACAKYVFQGLKCKRATFRTRTDHHAAIEAVMRLGCQVEGIQRGYYADKDALMFGLMRKDFRYGIV